MDRFRVKSLEKLLKSDVEDKIFELESELIKKYTLLLKGAKKYNRLEDIQIYEERLSDLKKF